VKGPRGQLVAVALLGAAALLLLAGGRGEPAARGAGLFCLAAVGGVLATRRIGRRLVGATTVLVGVATLLVADGLAVRVGAAMAVAAGTLVALFGPGWSTLSSRSAATPAVEGPGAVGPTDVRPASHDLWDALDRGEDPTLGR
jgi:hypothetical protein